jgi:azurin
MPVDKKTAQNASHYEVSGFTYHYHHHYGSPIINMENSPLKGLIVSEDGLKVRLVLDNIREGYIHEVKIADLLSADGSNLLHPVGYYTMNEIPSGEKLQLTESQKVHQHHAMAVEKEIAKVAKNKPEEVAKSTVAKRVTKMPATWTIPDQIISLGTKPGLKYSADEVQIKAGSKIKLVFTNNDDMTHNLVIVEPGAAREIGDTAFNMGLKGSQLQYIPASPKVLQHTNLVQPGASETIYFVAPTKPGVYTYLCTYPGHAMVMQGKMTVVK